MASGAHLDLTGKAAIVTGGTRGLGRTIATRLVEAGCAVTVCGRAMPDELPAGIAFHQADVRDPDQARALVEAAVAAHGRLDILVNNAGGSPQADAASVSPRFVDAILKLNLVAPLYMAQAAYPHMVAGGGGSIVNIASVSGARPSPAPPSTARPRRGCST